MKRKLLFIFILMSLCMLSIAGLQSYFSYRNYIIADEAFKKDANDALLEALDSTMAIHRINVGRQTGIWLADTSRVEIRNNWNNERQSSSFTLVELGTPQNESGSITLELGGLTKIKGPVTPEIKKRFIAEMETMVASQLKSGGIVYFTQNLGKDISRIYNGDVDTKIITQQYKSALEKRGITHSFILGTDKEKGEFCTESVNFGVNKVRWVKACFNHTGAYLLGQLKWVITGSVLLILLTLVCFWYTARMLLTQQKLSRLKDDFISNMTHEIHTPLTSITVTAEALKKFSHHEEERQAYIDIILHQSRKLALLTDEILTGARLEKKGLEMNDSIEVNQLLEDVIADFGDDGEKIGLKLSPQPITLMGNKLHLHNALANLIDNALKYNTFSEPAVSIACNAGKNLVITISDNGPGITDVDKKKVFDQFYRIPSGNVHNVKGYGLGLSYVKKVVEAHKGKITIEDNEPAGTKFIITLPL